MPSKEIKALRQAGRLEEAYTMAIEELQHEPDNIWCKRNLSWVLYNQLDEKSNDLNAFLVKIQEVKDLHLPPEEEMFFDNISIVISKAARAISHREETDLKSLHLLFDAIKNLPLKKGSKWYTALYKAFHKGMKDSFMYLEFANWWDFNNFQEEDFHKEALPNGKEVMALAEQAYIAYARHLLPQQTPGGETVFDLEAVNAFLPKLDLLIDRCPDFVYPPYFKAKLLLKTGDKNKVLPALLPMAKKKRNDFWVWENLAEAFSDEPQKAFACLCRALTCSAPEEMLVGLRQKMASLLIRDNQFVEAKTEIELLLKARSEKGYRVPKEVVQWQGQEWFSRTDSKASNADFYRQFTSIADGLLFSDVPEELVIVEFVNTDKKVLNFMASETKLGFFKYDPYLKKVLIGDILKVRFQPGTKEGLFKVFTLEKTEDEIFKKKFMKEVDGEIRIPEGKGFGFVQDIYVHPSIISKSNLTNGVRVKGTAMKTFNAEKKQWGWKIIQID